MAFYPVVEFGRRVRQVSTGCQEAMADMSSFLHETFAGHKIVKAFGMEKYEKKRFYDKTGNLFRLEMKAVIAKSLTSPIMEFLGGVGVAAVIGYGGYRVITGTSTPGTFFSSDYSIDSLKPLLEFQIIGPQPPLWQMQISGTP